MQNTSGYVFRCARCPAIELVANPLSHVHTCAPETSQSSNNETSQRGLQSSGLPDSVTHMPPSAPETSASTNSLNSGRSRVLRHTGGLEVTAPQSIHPPNLERVRRPHESVSPLRNVRRIRRDSSSSLISSDEDHAPVLTRTASVDDPVVRKDVTDSDKASESNAANTVPEPTVLIRNDAMPKRDPLDNRTDVDVRRGIVIAVLGEESPTTGDLVIPMVNGQADVQQFVNFHYSHGSFFQMRRPFRVIVDGAIDLGGPRREYFGALMASFYTAPVHEFNGESLWETNNGMTMPRYTPLIREINTQRMYEAFGGAAWNGLFHHLGFPVYLWQGIFRWMINLPWNRGDIYRWSTYIGKLVNKILSGKGPLDAATAQEVKEWVSAQEGFPGHLQYGSRDILAENIVDYELIYKNMHILLMIKRGFMKGRTEVVLARNRADWIVLERLLHRRVETAAEFLEQFFDLPDNSSKYEKAVFSWITDIVSEWDPDMIRKFLRFITAADFIPVLNRIRLIFVCSSGCNFVPAANTCFGVLKVGTSYPNKASFVEALGYAMANFENPDHPDKNRRFQDL